MGKGVTKALDVDPIQVADQLEKLAEHMSKTKTSDEYLQDVAAAFRFLDIAMVTIKSLVDELNALRNQPK